MSATPEREARIFSTARKLPAEDRAFYLEGACAGDARLRQRVEELLQANDAAGTFLEELGTGTEEAAPPPNPGPTLPMAASALKQPGDWIDRYKLLEKLGEGGWGVVFVAEQTKPVRRRVALKVIKPGMDTKAVVARFEAERQALAMMDHPSIARVLDAGTTDTGRPYFVMELVRGIRITDYCDQNQLTTRERLELFIKVCRAIQHAHQKGIIHRDIKPANILVTVIDGVAVPKVIDFGIAKATAGRLTDATVYTQLHQLMGTPAYMSPEQAEMSGVDIDTRSDIYSLGVLLYELLAGRTPFDSKELLASGLDAMRRTIREQEPMRPSTRFATLPGEEMTATAARRSAAPPKLRRQLQGDLDWIVMKCLEKDRAQRYMAASGLGADVQRHLDQEPVVARPRSNLYRFQKMARRHKAAFAAAALMAFALVGLAGASVRAAVVARQRQAESEAKTEFFKEVFRGLNNVEASRKISLASALGAAGRRLQAKGTVRGTPQDIFGPLNEMAGKLERDNTLDPARRAARQAQVADTYCTLGFYSEAVPLRQRVLDYCVAAQGPRDITTILAMRRLATCYCAIGRSQEALDLMAKSCELSPGASDWFLDLAAWQVWFGRDADYEATRHRLFEKGGERDDPTDPGWAEQRARVLCLTPSTNTALLAKALDLARRAVGLEYPATEWMRWHQLALGLAEYRNGQYEAAAKTLEVAEQPVVSPLRIYGDLPSMARMFRALSLFRLGRTQAARQLFKETEGQIPPLPPDEGRPVAEGLPFNHDLVICWLAYKEAKSVINGSDAKP